VRVSSFSFVRLTPSVDATPYAIKSIIVKHFLSEVSGFFPKKRVDLSSRVCERVQTKTGQKCEMNRLRKPLLLSIAESSGCVRNKELNL
jgi:hypothetical protein